MDTRVIPLRELETDTEGFLRRCLDSGESLVVEVPQKGFVSIQPVENDDDLVNELLEHNPAFRSLLAKSKSGPRKSLSPTALPESPDPSRATS